MARSQIVQWPRAHLGVRLRGLAELCHDTRKALICLCLAIHGLVTVHWFFPVAAKALPRQVEGMIQSPGPPGLYMGLHTCSACRLRLQAAHVLQRASMDAFSVQTHHAHNSLGHEMLARLARQRNVLLCGRMHTSVCCCCSSVMSTLTIGSIHLVCCVKALVAHRAAVRAL